jgi:hypothetical protein
VTAAGQAEEGWDGVPDRTFLKHRTAKLLAAAARQAAGDSKKAHAAAKDT